MKPKADLKGMVLEIEMYYQMIVSAKYDLSYHCGTYTDYFKLSNEIQRMATEYVVLLDMFVEEVEDAKQETDSNIFDLEVERYYRMAKEALQQDYIMI